MVEELTELRHTDSTAWALPAFTVWTWVENKVDDMWGNRWSTTWQSQISAASFCSEQTKCDSEKKKNKKKPVWWILFSLCPVWIKHGCVNSQIVKCIQTFSKSFVSCTLYTWCGVIYLFFLKPIIIHFIWQFLFIRLNVF